MLIFAAIFEKDDINPSYKIMWIIIFVVMPIFGVIMYLLWGNRRVPKKLRMRLVDTTQHLKDTLGENEVNLLYLKSINPVLYRNAYYLQKNALSPVYTDTKTDYYAFGEDFFEPFIEDLKKAKKFIFLEFFIYHEGFMWDRILDILSQKVKEGLDVRVVYDGVGCLFHLPDHYDQTIRSHGIKCHVFAEPRFSLNMSNYALLNHRDHRKIAIIDGSIGYSGGVNLADEYINAIERFGVWKDTVYRLEGPAVFSMTAFFLQTWDILDESENTDVFNFIPNPSFLQQKPPTDKDLFNSKDGVVQPYMSSPLENETIAQTTYVNIIDNAHDYVYISTPYLVIDDNMLVSLITSAKKGVDVRILTPGIPDKPYVYLLTQSYYHSLIRAGVKIYEYTPGFNHAKMMVSDDTIAVVGSANLDFRSLFLHFENCCTFYGGRVVIDTKEDLLQSYALSKPISMQDIHEYSFVKRTLMTIIRFFAPLL